MKTKITVADILEPKAFAAIRQEKRKEMVVLKKNKRLFVGPDVTIYFENYATIWWQIHEMLHIEKGGAAQIEDELLAYNPLIPQGHDLVATLMIEIDDPVKRLQTLKRLGGIENHILLRFKNHRIYATPTDVEDRTTADGKTSAVHFIRWVFSKDQVIDFKEKNQDIILEITHDFYPHKQIISENLRENLVLDLV